MQDHIQEFIDAMRAAGLGPADDAVIVDDDTPRYYKIDGDKKGKTRGSYALAYDGDGFAYGWFYDHRAGENHKWHSKAKGRSKDDGERHRAKVAAQRAARDASIKAAHDAASERAAMLWAKGSREGSTPYLARKRIGLNGARIIGDMLAIPMHKDGKLVGLQFIGADGEKRFLTDSDKAGSYHSMRGDDMSVIRICEGYATGCAIRDTYPANPVIVAWDAGNLKSAAKTMQAKYPDARIVICADNDQWTKKPDGTAWNPGIEKARQSAIAIGGASVVAPDFPADDPGKRTDWWDWWDAYGADGVRSAMDAATVAREPETDTPLDDVIDAGETFGICNANERHIHERVRPLGGNKGKYHFFVQDSGQIITKSARELAQMANLLDLAPIEFWETHYSLGKDSMSDIAMMAANHLVSICKRKVWKPSDLRGVGVWRDDELIIANTGTRIVGNGVDMPPSSFSGRYVYESDEGLIDLSKEPCADSDAAEFLDICMSLNWKRSQYGILLAGWLVVAPIGGCLRWKPHIWITGRSGAGKSTVMDKIVKQLLGKYAVCMDGGSSSAGVRNALGGSSRPFVMDEAESENQYDRNEMTKIIGLFRKASSGGKTGNANGDFQAMSCACFAAINPSVKETADAARITLLELEKDTSAGANDRYLALMDRIHATLTGVFPKRLIVRTFRNVDTLLHNIAAFENAASDMFGDKRQADQLAPMIAGAHFLTSLDKISVSDAKKWLERHDWQWYTSISDMTDAQKLIQTIMTSRISYDAMGMRREGAIGNLIEVVHFSSDGAGDIDRGLRPYGIKVKDGRVVIANGGSKLDDFLKNTPWVPWARTLGDYPGADNVGNKVVHFMAGLKSRATSIPIDALLDKSAAVEVASGEVEIPFDDGAFT